MTKEAITVRKVPKQCNLTKQNVRIRKQMI